VTKRIIGGFLAVLAVVLAGVVIPLGIIVTTQQAEDFTDQIRRAAQAIGAIAEERLDDHAPATGLQAVLDRFAADGYSAVVLDDTGRAVAHAGAPIPATALRAARSGGVLPAPGDAIAVAAPVGDAGRQLGHVVVMRDSTPLDERRRGLWMMLAAAAFASLGLGALVAVLISRWIARPLTELAGAAHSVGRADRWLRADEHAGPTQVRDVAAAFNTMADRVAELLQLQQDMTAEVSHQLRTPLAALRLRLELHRDELPQGPAAADITAMIDEIGRLSRLLGGLLAVARAEATAPSPALIDPGSVAADRVAAWEPIAADKRVDLLIDATPTVVATTSGYLEQILDNLLDNAIEASPPGGSVSITITTNSTGSAVTICDAGPGMSGEQRVEALGRWASDRVGDGGTGLGLAIVQRLVEADHGTVQLDESPAGGLRVRVHYPRTDRPIPATDGASTG
jgi:signal transduction histidine kinase